LHRAQLDAARSKLARTQASIELKSLQAPFAGTIGIPRIEVGEYVSVGTVIATLQDLDHITVDFSVPEQFIAQVSMGQPVRFGFGEDKLDISGKITGIDPRGDPQTRLVNVRADITDAAGHEIIPGRFLHVRIDLPAEQDVIAIPQTAVVTSLYGDYVYKVVADDREVPAQMQRCCGRPSSRPGGGRPSKSKSLMAWQAAMSSLPLARTSCSPVPV
jgi:membrane fusion protein (multidrug efflux system)